MVMVQFIVAEVVPDVPDEVEIQIQRMEFIRSKVLDKVEDDDLDEAELERMNSTASAAAREEQSNTYICCGTSCAVLPCCRTHKGKYLEKKMNLTNCSEVVVKQYPVLSTTLHKNPMQQQIRSGI